MTNTEEAIKIVRRQVRVHVLRQNVHYSMHKDLRQEALLRMVKHIHRYDPKKAKLTTFLEHHTRGAIQDFLRKRDGYVRHRNSKSNEMMDIVSLGEPIKGNNGIKNRVIDIPDMKTNPETQYINQEELPALVKKLREHTVERYWLVLRLRILEEKSFVEIGKIIGVSDRYASTIYFLALKKLKRVLFSMGIIRLSQLVDH
jgi:RNA polymerase sigma factor (sigma-70 family)